MIRAALVQYSEQDITIIRCKNIRTEDQVIPLIDEALNDTVLSTVVSLQMRNKSENSLPARAFPH